MPSCVQVHQIRGKWYIKALVGTGFQLPKVVPVVFRPLGSGTLQASLTYRAHGQCRQLNITFEKAAEPGRYSYLGGLSTLQVEGTPAGDHVVFYSESLIHGKRHRLAKLMGRTLAESPIALEAFKEFVRRKGFREEQIYWPAQEGSCSPERSLRAEATRGLARDSTCKCPRRHTGAHPTPTPADLPTVPMSSPQAPRD
ncbi:odorant-binding protein 2b-like [Sorex araneus]|uniref:odorant-binding protein 2b-like n=1 Tax=Sorex araneus TaxID=42254 RepID=UPI002433B5FC|nr:odorant-binding protein 2b-like [Sorex araneus]